MIKVSFAASRPKGAYALAIPVRGEEMVADRLGGLDDAARALAVRAADAQRFEREVGAIAETFVDEGDERPPAAARRPRRPAERRGGLRESGRRADRAGC